MDTPMQPETKSRILYLAICSGGDKDEILLKAYRGTDK